jgi:Xaa-Pro dipeptidase
MFAVRRDAVRAMTEAAKPGRPLGEIDDAHRRAFDAAGFSARPMAACGYSLGTTYRPGWMDLPPTIYSSNRQAAMLQDHTVVVTDTGCSVLSRLPPSDGPCT